MTLKQRKSAFVIALLATIGAAANLLAMQSARRAASASSVVATTERIPHGMSDLPAPPKNFGAPGIQTPRTSAPRVETTAAIPAVPATNTAEVVRGIQRELNTRGYDAGQPDGVVGLVTRGAILAYEHDYGLALTASPSDELLQRIVLGSSAPAGAASSDRQLSPEAQAVVASVKQYLTALGYQPGKVDGAITPQLRRTIREFEIAQKLTDSGRISGPLVSRLIRLQAAAQQRPNAGARSAQR